MILPRDNPAAGATEALFEVYLELRPTLLRIFAARLRSADAAEDLAQEVYLRVTRTAPDAVIEDPRAWLFKVASNLVVDRRRERLRGDQRDAAWLAHTTEPEAATGASPSPERVVAGRQVLDKALAAVDAMPPRMAEAFRLTRLQGLSHAEAGRRMGVSSKAVEKHVASALARLTAEMRGLWP